MSPFCDLCRHPVVWALTAANGKWIALNPDLDDDGNQAAYRDHTETLRTRQLRKDEEPLGFERRYMPHFATCQVLKQRAELARKVIPISRAPSLRHGRRTRGNR
jgi:hypothetical protein